MESILVMRFICGYLESTMPIIDTKFFWIIYFADIAKEINTNNPMELMNWKLNL